MAWTDTFTLASDDGRVRVSGLSDQSVRSLKAVFAADGVELKVVDVRRGDDMARRSREARGIEEWDDPLA